MNYKNIIMSICLLVLSSIFYYIGWIWWIINLFLSLLFYWSIFYLITYSFKKIKHKNIEIFNKVSYNEYISNFYYKSSIFIVIIFSILAFFWYYQNNISPAKMPIFTISNWEKTVIFQSMSHIWTQNFYNNVKNNIEEAKKNGYIYFFEWVKAGTNENMEKFNNALWIKFEEDLYENMAKLYWLKHQENEMFFNLVNDNDYNVDLSIDKIIEYYEKETSKNETNNSKDINITPTADINNLIKEALNTLTDEQLVVIRYINKAIINMIIKNENIQASLTNNLWNKDIFNIILWKRNELVASEIINNENKKIIITYWLLHFNGIFELLKNNDKNWKLVKTDYFYPLKD